ncbi:MAG: ABC transporter permease, partial [Halanaerobiales bacterium]
MNNKPELILDHKSDKTSTRLEKEEYNFWREKWRRLRRHKMAMIGGIVILIIYLLVIFAGFLGPYNQYYHFKSYFFHPPTRVRIFDEGQITRPYVYGTERVGWAKYETIENEKYPIKFLHRGQEYKFLGIFKTDLHLFGADEPGHIFLMGTDNYGRDIFTRLLFGGRVSMFIGFIGIIISTIIGLLVGGIAGYYGGWIDNLLMRVAEVIMSIPSFYLLLALAAVLPTEMPSSTRFMLIIAILSFIGWAGLSRVIRGMVLSIRNEEYVFAAQAMGARDGRIIRKHVLPKTATYVIVSATVAIPGYIIMESGLSFLGLGIQEPSASWGNMLTAAQSVTKIVNFPWMLIPGFTIFIAVLSYNLL